jgi:hypothetical protein
MIFDGDGCYSSLGKTGGQQYISLQKNGCLYSGTIHHQFMHAAGFALENNRSDRDNHVDILWDNILQDWKSQYEKTNPNGYGLQSNYNYYSIMHYPYNAPGANKPAFRPNVDTNRMGNGNVLTPTDLEKLRILYC